MIGDVLDDLEGQRGVEPLARGGELFGGGDPVIDRKAVRRGMRARNIDRGRRRIDPRHDEAEPRHRLGDETAATADIDKPELLKRPQIARVAAKMCEQLPADELQYSIQRKNSAAGRLRRLAAR